VIEYDFTKLLTVADAEALTELVNSKTKDLDIAILVNNVGILRGGPYHKTALEKMFNSFTVNIAAQSVMTHIFANRWMEERKGKKCLVIDYSSVVALKPMGGAPLYCAEKSYNAIFSECLGKQYEAAYKKDPINMPNIEFMRVYPNSVKSALNSGRLLFTVTSE
jgi:short-subunit dehydrogenase